MLAGPLRPSAAGRAAGVSGDDNAGIGGPSNPTGEYAIEDWNRVVATNLSGVFYSMRYELPAIVAAGGGAVGRPFPAAAAVVGGRAEAAPRQAPVTPR